ncbi:vegetative cell wall protein gp1-like [Gallus gallus]|uniref:vegetative cell wall protein gp1-like n=1 Tax=Gallus gallus TaxID=9031 RepID=UPI001AEA68DD|nr:vegetative cell wall protein gp1-like [Gallus gallus]
MLRFRPGPGRPRLLPPHPSPSPAPGPPPHRGSLPPRRPLGRLSPGPAPPSSDVRSAPRSAPAPPLGTHLLAGIRGASPLRPGGCAPPFPLPRSLPPAAAPRPSDGGGGKPRRAAPPPQPRRAAPRPRPPPRCPPRTHLPRGRRARQEGTAWSESPCHEAGLRRAASIGAATAVRSAVTALVTAMTAPSRLGRAARAQLQPRATGRPDGTGCMCGQVKGSKDLKKEMVERAQIQDHCCTAKDHTGDCVRQSPGSFPVEDGTAGAVPLDSLLSLTEASSMKKCM